MFLRGVNVGGNKVFRPSLLAAELAQLDVVNVGAAGTFVVRGTVTTAALRAEILRRLTFETDVVICGGRDVLELVASDPFRDYPGPPEVTRFVTVLARRPRTVPPLPFEARQPDRCEMTVFGVRGRFVLWILRRLSARFLDPVRLVADTSFGATGTTRNWNTIVKIAAVLGSPARN